MSTAKTRHITVDEKFRNILRLDEFYFYLDIINKISTL